MTNRIRVLVVDDDAFITRTLSGLFQAIEDIECVGVASNGVEAIQQVDSLIPDLILMDVVMPTMDGVEATKTILRGASPPKILMWTTFEFNDALQAALEAGASGFLLKSTTAEALFQAVRATMHGITVLGAEPAKVVAQTMPRINANRVQLTKRELAVLELIADGASNTAIARQTYLSESTVKNVVTALKQKLRVSSRAQLIASAHELPDLSAH